MPCPRIQQANLPACSPQPPINAERQAGKLRIPFFKVFWYDSTRGMNPWSTDYEADALTTTPSGRSLIKILGIGTQAQQQNNKKLLMQRMLGYTLPNRFFSQTCCADFVDGKPSNTMRLLMHLKLIYLKFKLRGTKVNFQERLYGNRVPAVHLQLTQTTLRFH